MEQTSTWIARSVTGNPRFSDDGCYEVTALSLGRYLYLAQATLKAGSTDPCSQPLTSQGHARVVGSESSFLLLHILI